MTTMADMVADTKRMAYGSLPEQINLLAANAAAGATILQMQMPVEGIVPGTVLSSGLNVWYVKGATTAGNTVSVVPGYSGAPLNAAAIDDFVYVRPRVTDWYVFSTLNDVIRSLSAPTNGLHTVAEWTSAVDTSYNTYSIPVEAQNMVGMLQVEALYPQSPDRWQKVPSYMWQLQKQNNTIRLLQPVMSNSTLKFIYKSPFQQATGLADDPVADLGMYDAMLDIPPLGAVVTLLRTTESRRSQVNIQGDPRRADEVQSGANANIAREFQRDFKARIDDEYIRLTTQTSIYKGI